MHRKEELPKRAFREGTGRVPGVARRENPRRRYCGNSGTCVEDREQDYPPPAGFPVSRARAAARVQRTPFRGVPGAGVATHTHAGCGAVQQPRGLAAPPAGHSPQGA